MKSLAPLAGYPVAATSRVCEAEECISRSIADARIDRVDDRHDFRFELNAVRFDRFALIYNCFDARTLLSTGAEQDHAIFITGMGVPIALHIAGERHVVTRNKAVIVGPANCIRIERPARSEILYLRVSLADLRHYFEKITDSHQRGALLFAPQVSAVNGSGAVLKGLMNCLANLFTSNAEAVRKPIISKSYADLLMSTLLALPHNKSSLLDQNHSVVAPAIVRRAEEYMQAHLHEPVTVPDLVQVCNCSRSVLFAAFRNARNYTPMEFLTEQRLSFAREQLLHAKPKASTAAIALNCGFLSYSWFSQLYKRRFGERPYDTLRNRK